VLLEVQEVVLLERQTGKVKKETLLEMEQEIGNDLTAGRRHHSP
jgi:hypothetical protein